MTEDNYKLVESLQDETLLFLDEDKTQQDQRDQNSKGIIIPYATILSCSVCHLTPSFNKYEDLTLPPSISRRFSIFCPKCSSHPLRMFTLEGMVGYWNRVRR
jgi:hypothetical protein